MSHFTTVQTKIFDLGALEDALKHLKFNVAYNALVHGWAGSRRKADLVAKSERSPYHIGFIHNKKTGTYDMVADWWGIKSTTGQSEQLLVSQIKQHYAYHKVLKEVQEQGFLIAEDSVESDQSIRLVVRKW